MILLVPSSKTCAQPFCSLWVGEIVGSSCTNTESVKDETDSIEREHKINDLSANSPVRGSEKMKTMTLALIQQVKRTLTLKQRQKD